MIPAFDDKMFRVHVDFGHQAGTVGDLSHFLSKDLLGFHSYSEVHLLSEFYFFVILSKQLVKDALVALLSCF